MRMASMSQFGSEGPREHEATAVRRSWRCRSLGGWCFGCVLLSLACGEVGDLAGAPGSPTGGTGGVGGAPGSAAAGQGGRVRPTATAPACTAESDATPFVHVVVSGPRSEEPESVRVLESGVGLPSGMTLPTGATSADQLGWLRLEVLTGTSPVDAGANDVGLHDAGPNDNPERILLGSGELAELPVAIGDELALAVEHHHTGGGTVYGEEHQRTVLQRDDQVVLYHQVGLGLGTYSGVTLARGNAICADPYPNDDHRCAYIYHHALEVTVPGGATATLMSGQVQAVGDYRAIHGSTTVQDFSPRLTIDECADLYYYTRSTELTVVLRPPQ